MKQYNVYSKKAEFCDVYRSLKAAKDKIKELIKQGFDDVTRSITKVWNNGEWEPMGEITLKGSNKTYCANTRQKVKSYN